MLEAAYKDTLYIISDEMKVTLNDIKEALEQAIDTKNNKHLSMVRELLHSAKGALNVIDFKASALLASEMILSVDTLLENKISNPHNTLDAISSGVVLLPAFFSKTVESEGKENSIALLPVLQELRAARNAKPLSEDTLFLLDIKGDELSDKTVQIPSLNNKEDLRLLIGKYRPIFQNSLLGWIKDASSEKHLIRLGVITEKFEKASKQERTFKLWWVTGGLIEALRDNGLKSSPELRRLFGQVDRAGKMILDFGEDHYKKNDDRTLINQLLYFISRSVSAGKRISEIRQAFSLNESLQFNDKFQSAKNAMAAPDTEVMNSLSIAIREDLDKVKDALDIFNRTGSKENLQIEKRFESLKKIADTLQMLGLTELEKRVLEQKKELTEIVTRKEPLTDNHLISIAASLLQVESRLEEELDKLAGKKSKEMPRYLLEALEATYRESKVNLARVKEVISQFMRDPTDIKPISRAPILLKESQAAIMMTGKERLALVLGRLQDYINRQLIGSGRLPYAEHLELLAGAIESVDFYLETLNKGRRDPWYMLDNADSCLEQLLRDAPAPLVGKERTFEPASHDSTITLNTIPSVPQGTGTVAMPALTPEAIERMKKQSHNTTSEHPDAYPIMDQALQTDPEVIEIFIEEANEVHIEINREFQVWRNDNTQREALVSVRRGFHTLKGSGRMVGARRLGELAWQAEHLINRVLEGTVKLDDDGLHLLDRAVAVIPSLIEQLESGADTAEDAHQLMLSLESFVEQKLNAPDGSERPPGQTQIIRSGQINDTQLINVQDLTQSQTDASESEVSENEVSENEVSENEVSENEVSEERPHTQIIDMRSMMTASPDSENAYTQIMDMRKLLKDGDTSSIEDLLKQSHDDEDKKDQDDDQNIVETSSVANATKAYHLENTLFDIYTAESAKHLQVIQDFCRDSVGSVISNNMHRAVHTLHGSANMAGLTPIMTLSADLEHYIQRLYDEGLPLKRSEAETVANAANVIEEMIATINQDQSMPLAPEELLIELQQLRNDIDQTIGEAREEQLSFDDDSMDIELVLDDELEISGTGSATDQLISEDDLADIFSQTTADINADDLADASSDLLPKSEPEAINESLDFQNEDLVETEDLLDELEVELDDILLVADNDATDKNEIIAHAPTMLAVDSEITDIFLEEAQEIISQTDNALSSWDESGLTDEKNIELQRYLHTLKGGARMAGLLSIGDFTHELESFVIALKNNAIDQNDLSRKVMQSAVDHMHMMLDDVQNGTPPTTAPEILDSMQSLIDGTYDAHAELSDQHSVEPVETPDVVVDASIPDAPEQASADQELEFSDDSLSAQELTPEADLDSLDESSEDITVTSEVEFKDATIFSDTYAEMIESHGEDVSTDHITPEIAETHEQHDTGESIDSIFEYAAEVVPIQQRQQDAARISTTNLESLLNQAGEISIFRSRIEQELSNANLNLAELARTVQRVKEQLRKMEIETEATILYQHRDEADHQDFDPLEMDRYSNVQQVSRALAESVNDLSSLETLLAVQFRDTEALLLQQSRVMTDLQDNLMRVRMIPFARYAPRYARIVRQIATETGKEVELNVIGADSEIDRQVIERMQAPLEHMIRNAVVHGIELPEERKKLGKDPEGTIELCLSREGAQLLLELKDDGAGLNLNMIREKAIKLGLLPADQEVTDADLTQLILNTGLSTADSVTQSAGRGVGMDVVASEIKQLGGSLQIFSEQGAGTRFLMRLPFTRAINHALMVRVAEENYAIPIHKIDGVAKMSLSEVQRLLASENPVYRYADKDYVVKSMAQLVGSHHTGFEPDEHVLSVIMVTGGDHHAALVINELMGSREMVIKPVGPQIAAIRGISGATILGDGRIVIILDIDALLGVKLNEIAAAQIPVEQVQQPLILVVDDSITVRRVTERLLERNKIQVLTARDGLDALNVLQEHQPDLILMDIEMPRMDGYELAERVRKDQRFKNIPIIMITSRTGDKHRSRAMEIGVDDYLGKPYREDQLLEAIKPHLDS